MAVASKGEVDVVLGGVERRLSLKIGDLEEIEARLNLGIGSLIDRFMKSYRLTDVRTVLQVALEKSVRDQQWTRESVLEMIKVEGPVAHARTCARLLVAALEPLPGGNPPKPDGEKEAQASRSGVT